MTKSKQAAQSVLTLILFAILSKVFGFFREALIAARFGSGIETDTFFIAQSANAIFTAIITSSLATTTIPILSRIETVEGKKGKIEHASNLLSITLIVAIGLLIVAWFSAPLVMKIFAFGFNKPQFDFAVFMMRLGLPAILLAALNGVFNGYLQSENRFLASSISGITQNFFYIAFLIFLASTFGIKGLMITYIIGMSGQLLVLITGSRKAGFRYKFALDIKDKYVQQVFVLIPPILLSVAISDINSMIDKAMASTLVNGSISALNYASRLNTLVSSIFVSAIVTVLYPLLSAGAAKKDMEELKKTTVQGINVIMLITIPAMVGMLILAKPIVKLAYQRGAFDAVATQMTVGALIFYTLCLVASSVKGLIARVFYSLHDTKTPMINSAIAVGINVIMNFILIKPLAHRGLALATSISSITTTIILIMSLRKKIGALKLSRALKCGLKSIVASLIMAVVVILIYTQTKTLFSDTFFGLLSSLLIPIGSGALLYFALLYLFKVEELTWIVNLFKSRIKRNNKS